MSAIQIDMKVANRVAQMLMSTNPRTFQQGVAAIKRTPAIMTNLNSAFTAIATNPRNRRFLESLSVPVAQQTIKETERTIASP